MAGAPLASQTVNTALASSVASADPFRTSQHALDVGGCCGHKRSEDERRVGWSYVGEGRGRYQQVDGYNYVGEGAGDYDRELVRLRKNALFRNCCLGSSCCLMLSTALLSLLYLAREHNSATPSENTYQVMPNQSGHDCVTGFETWRTSWSNEQKEWCCEHHQRGCLSFDCQDYQGTPEWSVDKMAWCCQHKKVGCSHGCNAKCEIKGELASCQQRIRWASENVYKHNPDACGLAHGLVIAECHICATCLLEASGCNQSRAYDCFDGLRNYKAGWSASKKQWCCDRMGVACPFDCDADFSNWQEGWSEAKRQWCCQSVKRGCTTTSTIPPEPYDCEASLSNWKNEWSNAKKRWCCQEYGHGCSTTQSPPVVVGPTTSAPAGSNSSITLTTTIIMSVASSLRVSRTTTSTTTTAATTTATTTTSLVTASLVTSTTGNSSNAPPSSTATSMASSSSSSSSSSDSSSTNITGTATTATATLIIGATITTTGATTATITTLPLPA